MGNSTLRDSVEASLRNRLAARSPIQRMKYEMFHLLRQRYAKNDGDTRWITIGGSPEDDKKHVGGTPVRVDGQGRIHGGPDALVGKKLGELDKDVAGTAKDERKGNEPPKATTTDTKPSEPPKTPIQSGNTEPEQQSSSNPMSLFDSAVESGETPREAAEKSQKATDADYAFARSSAIPNAGEDLKGSARHKVNAWRGLQEAEDNGTAEQMVTRDNLLKAEPHNLMSLADKNPLTALAMHNALKSLPAKPGYGNEFRMSRRSADEVKKDRSQFLDAYRDIKAKAEELATNELDPREAMNKLQGFVRQRIQDLRQTRIPVGDLGHTEPDRYNNTANALTDIVKKLSGSGWEVRKTTNLHNKLGQFVGKLAEKYNNQPMSDIYGNVKEHVKDLIEGRSMPAIFGESKGGTKKTSDFNPADQYVTHAVRKGGPDLGAEVQTPQKATNYMVEKLGMRGVQWGNSVTDDERQHHAKMSAEAFADLADVLNLPPEAVSLGGKLGLAIGARGHGTAAAHYEPGSVVINLTRKNGVGTVAHEWGHGFDHMLSGFATNSTGGDYMSERLSAQRFKTSANGGYEVGPDRKPIVEDMSKDPIWSAMDGVRKAFQASGFETRLRSVLSDLRRKGSMSDKKAEYWRSTREVFARSFERHVQHKLQEAGRENTYLSGLAEKGGDGNPHPLWPSKEESAAMAPAFEALFAAYRAKSGAGAEKYSREELVRYFMRGFQSDHHIDLASRIDGAIRQKSAAFKPLEGQKGLLSRRRSRQSGRHRSVDAYKRTADRMKHELQQALTAALAKRQRYSWNEADHPRGQPDNAGQFAPKDGGNKARSETKPTRNLDTSKVKFRDGLIEYPEVEKGDYEKIEDLMTPDEWTHMRNYLWDAKEEEMNSFIENELENFDPDDEIDMDQWGEDGPDDDDLESERKSVIAAKRNDLERDFEIDYEPRHHKHQYLDEFYDEHEDDPRFNGGLIELGEWGLDTDDDLLYGFKTSAGSVYQISVSAYRANPFSESINIPQLVFADQDNSVAITGAGNAREVFNNVTSATVALMKQKSPEGLYFSAAEPSRQKLYDRLVKTLAHELPDYEAVAATSPEGKRYYAVAKPETMAEIASAAGSQGIPLDSLAKKYSKKDQPAKWRFTAVEAEYNPAWATDDSEWSEFDSPNRD